MTHSTLLTFADGELWKEWLADLDNTEIEKRQLEILEGGHCLQCTQAPRMAQL